MDTIEAKKNLKKLRQNLECLDNYNHLNSTYQFEQSCFAERKKTVQQISNIEWQLKQNRC